MTKFFDLMKDLKYEHQSIFLCGGGSKLILCTPAAVVFSPNCQKITLWHKRYHYPPRWICITHIWSPTLFTRGILIFKGVRTKLNFLMKFPHLEKIVDLIKDLKYEHQSIFPLCRRVKLNFSDRYRKPNRVGLNFQLKNRP